MTRLSPDLLLHAYCNGVFPMADHDGQIRWFSPDPRCIFELEGLRISRSLRRTLDRAVYQTRINTAFGDVLEACADRGEGTWISSEIVEAYTALHELGLAHSVESWRGGRLCGGLYGVCIGGAFFGESMFHRESDASKVALVALVARMRQRGLTLLDTQWSTPHLESLGAVEIPRDEYIRRLQQAIRLPVRFVDPA